VIKYYFGFSIVQLICAFQYIHRARMVSSRNSQGNLPQELFSKRFHQMGIQLRPKEKIINNTVINYSLEKRMARVLYLQIDEH